MRLKSVLGAAALGALGLTAACTPVRDQHGYIPDSQEATQVQVGVDTKTTVLARMGTPSTVGAFDSEAWYYVSQTQERLAFFNPRTTQRDIIAVRFGKDDVVAAVDRFGVEKGRVVAYSDAKTPTRGRELTLIEQLLGSVGRPAGLPSDETEQNRQRRR